MTTSLAAITPATIAPHNGNANHDGHPSKSIKPPCRIYREEIQVGFRRIILFIVTLYHVMFQNRALPLTRKWVRVRGQSSTKSQSHHLIYLRKIHVQFLSENFGRFPKPLSLNILQTSVVASKGTPGMASKIRLEMSPSPYNTR